jgi:hypothetical protein
MFFSRILSWIVLIGFLLIGGALLRSAWRRPGAPEATDDGLRHVNRFLGWTRLGFIGLCVSALGLHAYWAMAAAGPFAENARYARIKESRDQRERRLRDASLRGWIFDRSNLPEKALARYTAVGGRIYRTYPLGADTAHALGYASLVRGDAGVEKAFETKLTHPVSTFNSLLSAAPVGSDIHLSLDYDLQRTAATQLRGQRGAVVVLKPTTGEILAMVSAPSFDPQAIYDDAQWKKLLENDAKPLLNRAINQYYLPGSTFKMVVAAAALEANLAGQKFTCTGDGFTPPGSARAIRDDKGEVHGAIDLARAVEESCNQYFAQMALQLGSQRLGDGSVFTLKTRPKRPAKRASPKTFGTPTARNSTSSTLRKAVSCCRRASRHMTLRCKPSDRATPKPPFFKWRWSPPPLRIQPAHDSRPRWRPNDRRRSLARL